MNELYSIISTISSTGHQASACVSPTPILSDKLSEQSDGHLDSASVSLFQSTFFEKQSNQLTMDINKLNILTLTGPNWESYEIHIQSATWILDCYDELSGELKGTSPQTYNTLLKPDQQSHPDADKCIAATAIWNKKNSMELGLIQGTMSPTIWPDFVNHGTAKALWDALMVKFGKVGGAQTYLQLVNMITIKMTDSENLLAQVQEFQEDYLQILTNGHLKFSDDLVMFTFCSAVPSTYKETAHQYLHDIDDITKYNLLDIIT